MKNKKETGKDIHLHPWLDKEGKPKCDEAMKKVSPFWSKGTWEGYLSTLDKKQEEYLLNNPKALENFSAQAYAQFLMSIDTTEKGLDRLKILAKTCLNQLSPRELEVLKKIFLKKKSQKQIANELGISRGSIKTLKSRGLKKIKRFMITGGFHQKALLYREFSMTDFP